MSHCHHKRRRHQSRSLVHNRDSQQDRNNHRSTGYDKQADFHECHHNSIQPNRQYSYFHPPVLATTINEITHDAEKHPPIVQTLIRELLLERKKRQLIENRLNMREHEYAHLHAQHEAIGNNLALLKHDYDQCRLDLKARSIELNELRHHNHQLRVHVDQLLIDDGQQMNINNEMFYSKRQRKY
ncbi:unnamed protein product [Rotaria socialis]